MEKNIQYKGFDITITKEESIWHEVECYYSAYKLDDGWTLASGHFDIEESIEDKVKELKDLIDDYWFICNRKNT